MLIEKDEDGNFSAYELTRAQVDILLGIAPPPPAPQPVVGPYIGSDFPLSGFSYETATNTPAQPVMGQTNDGTRRRTIELSGSWDEIAAGLEKFLSE